MEQQDTEQKKELFMGNAVLSQEEEHLVWKKNAPYLYDFLLTHSFTWPSLTVQWLPDVEYPGDRDYNVHKLLAGTYTSGQEPEFLQILFVHIPNEQAEIDAMQFGVDQDEVGGYGAGRSKMTVHQRICHEGEVNCARYMPQNPAIIASKITSGEVHLFDCTKHPTSPEDMTVAPDLRLVGQTLEGYGLAWNTLRDGLLLGASLDKTICLWDIRGVTRERRAVEPLTTFRTQDGAVNSVAWHKMHENIFGCVGEDRRIIITDIRAEPESWTLKREEAHEKEIHSIAFNYANEHFFSTGGADALAKVWDMRNLDKPFLALEGHQNDILTTEWSPHVETVLASGSYDQRIYIWDVSRTGHEQTPDEQEDGPPELLFIHGGHTSAVMDLNWDPSEPWLLASTAEDNVIHVWQMDENIYCDG